MPIWHQQTKYQKTSLLVAVLKHRHWMEMQSAGIGFHKGDGILADAWALERLRSLWSSNWVKGFWQMTSFRAHLPKATLISGPWVKPNTQRRLNGTVARVKYLWGQEESQKHHHFLKWLQPTTVIYVLW